MQLDRSCTLKDRRTGTWYGIVNAYVGGVLAVDHHGVRRIISIEAIRADYSVKRPKD